MGRGEIGHWVKELTCTGLTKVWSLIPAHHQEWFLIPRSKSCIFLGVTRKLNENNIYSDIYKHICTYVQW